MIPIFYKPTSKFQKIEVLIEIHFHMLTAAFESLIFKGNVDMFT